MCAKRSALTRSGTRVHGTAVANPPDHSGGGLAPLRSEAHTGAGQRPGGRGPRVQEGGGVRRRDGTRGGLRPPRGAKTTLASSHAGLIHPSAWKWNSRKFISKILHSPSPKGLETADSLGLIPNLQPYILWCCINMRELGCTVIAALL